MPNSESDLELKQLIDASLREDGRDPTSEAIFGANERCSAQIKAQAAGVLCGVEVARAVFAAVDSEVEFTVKRRDGAAVAAGDLLIELKGRVRSLLRGERPALNFMQQLSAVATLTASYVDAVKGTRLVILDTRKTIPGLRHLQKYAVRVGGGRNHRLNLEAMCMIKDNHITAAGGIEAAVRKVRKSCTDKPLEVEAASLADVELVLKLMATSPELNITRLMLDNFSVAEVKQAVQLCGGRVPLEVSGGVDLSTVREYALTGADFASVGRLTHSAPALDMHMELDLEGKP